MQLYFVNRRHDNLELGWILSAQEGSKTVLAYDTEFNDIGTFNLGGDDLKLLLETEVISPCELVVSVTANELKARTRL